MSKLVRPDGTPVSLDPERLLFAIVDEPHAAGLLYILGDAHRPGGPGAAAAWYTPRLAALHEAQSFMLHHTAQSFDLAIAAMKNRAAQLSGPGSKAAAFFERARLKKSGD
jgi:hypothetical protein